MSVALFHRPETKPCISATCTNAEESSRSLDAWDLQDAFSHVAAFGPLQLLPLVLTLTPTVHSGKLTFHDGGLRDAFIPQDALRYSIKIPDNMLAVGTIEVMMFMGKSDGARRGASRSVALLPPAFFPTNTAWAPGPRFPIARSVSRGSLVLLNAERPLVTFTILESNCIGCADDEDVLDAAPFFPLNADSDDASPAT